MDASLLLTASQQMQLLEILSLMELFTDLLLQHLGSNSITEPSPWGLPHNCPFKDMLTPPHCLLTCKIRGTSCDTVSPEELRVHPSPDVTLSCHFSFVEGIENLEFSWEREDIKEDYEVEDDKAYYHFLRDYMESGLLPTRDLRVEGGMAESLWRKSWKRWEDGERDLSNHSTVEVLEEQMNGFHRVLSVLKYPVKLDEKHVCCITETDVNNQPFRIIHKYPSGSPDGVRASGRKVCLGFQVEGTLLP
uniref:uncharacterized protein LOC118547977 isoform X4 n=1 Tax=Halichoerus grypus TaxID=9711 RepID=UPI0016599EED|nr:uncharacterized protein LOC118547977 isoform X4 [Halichoerus grypus]